MFHRRDPSYRLHCTWNESHSPLIATSTPLSNVFNISLIVSRYYIYEYWAETIEQITWTNVLQNRCYMFIQWTRDMFTLFRLSSGPFFSCFSYFSYFFLKKPYYPCFFKSSKRNLPHMALCREDVYDIFLWGPTYGFKSYMPLVRTCVLHISPYRERLYVWTSVKLI